MQKINLYPLEEEITDIKLPAVQIFKYFIFIFIFLFFTSSIIFYKIYSDNKKLDNLQKQDSKLTAELANLESQIKEKTNKTQYTKVIQELDLAFIKNQKKKDILTNLKKTASSGFANHMQALSKNSINGLWLTDFKLLQHGNIIFLSGETTENELIPKLLLNLGKTKTFSNKNFEFLKINILDDRKINFTIGTENNG